MLSGPAILQVQPTLTPEVAVIFAIIGVVLEPVPVDVTALGPLVTLVVLERWTGVSPAAATTVGVVFLWPP